MSDQTALLILSAAILGATTLLWWRGRPLTAHRNRRHLVAGLVVGVLSASGMGLLLTGPSLARPADSEVFATIPLADRIPPDLSDVRFQNSPTNGLEVYLQHGTTSILVCYASPDQIQIGSCNTPETTLIRETSADGDDIRRLRIVQFRGPIEERAKADDTGPELAVIEFWRTAVLQKNPSWLRPFLR